MKYRHQHSLLMSLPRVTNGVEEEGVLVSGGVLIIIDYQRGRKS